MPYVSCGGADTYIWPGGGITLMVDVMDMPANSFVGVPTPALVAPIEFTLRVSDYSALGGHLDQCEVLRISMQIKCVTYGRAQMLVIQWIGTIIVGRLISSDHHCEDVIRRSLASPTRTQRSDYLG